MWGRVVGVGTRPRLFPLNRRAKKDFIWKRKLGIFTDCSSPLWEEFEKDPRNYGQIKYTRMLLWNLRQNLPPTSVRTPKISQRILSICFFLVSPIRHVFFLVRTRKISSLDRILSPDFIIKGDQRPRVSWSDERLGWKELVPKWEIISGSWMQLEMRDLQKWWDIWYSTSFWWDLYGFVVCFRMDDDGNQRELFV